MSSGVIETGNVQIVNAEFKTTTIANKYKLEITFYDPKYNKTQYSCGGPLQQSGSVGPGKAQAPGQLPSYFVRILKKTTPSDQNVIYSNLESLWQDYASFNDQEYTAIDGSTFTADGLGVGLTPFYYSFTSSTWSYSSISLTNATYNGGNFKIAFDASGGAVYTAGPGTQNIVPVTPLKQAIFNASNQANPYLKYCKSYSDNNGFYEPGCYLIVVMRNTIDNIVDTSIPNNYNNIWKVDTASSLTSANLSAALVVIKPPSFVLTYDPVNDWVTFNVKAYGSNNIYNNAWTILNSSAIRPIFITPKYPYSNIGSSGVPIDYPLRSFTDIITFNPANNLISLDNLDLFCSVSKAQVIEDAYEDFTIRGAFVYDFRFSKGDFSTFNPYSIDGDGFSYVNYLADSNLNAKLAPNFETDWLSKVQIAPINQQTIRNVNNTTLLNPVVYSNTYTIDASIKIPIELNTSIVKIGPDHKYIFRSEWTELYPYLLTDKKINDKFVLRLYKQSKTQTGNSYTLYSSNPINTLTDKFKYTISTDTGLDISTSWYTIDGNNNKIIAYTSRNGDVYFNNEPSDGTLSSDVQYWNENQIRGGWFMVLQRNFSSDTNLRITTQGHFVHKLYPDPPNLLVTYDSTSKFPISLSTEYTNEFANAKNYWSQRGTGIYSSDPDYILELSDNLLAVSDPTISQIRSVYNDYNNHQLFNRVEIDFGISNESFIESLPDLSSGSFEISSNSYTGNTFYEASSNYVDINTPNTIPPIPLDISIVNIGNEYGFNCQWTEPYYEFITNNVTGSEYSLRLYKRDPSRIEQDEQAYLSISGQVENYKFVSSSNTGLDVEPVGHWFEVSPSHKMNIVVDKSGNIHYLNSSTSPTNVTDISLNGYGWTQEEIFGGWIMVLQRNFTFADALDVLNVNTQACFASNFELAPSLIVYKDINNLPSNFETTITGIYKNSLNYWSTIELPSNNVTQLTDYELLNNPNPNISELQDILAVGDYTNSVNFLNHVELDMSFGEAPFNFEETYFGLIFTSPPAWNNLTITDISKIDQNYVYEISTNYVTIYDRVQSKANEDYLVNMNCTYGIKNTNEVFFKLLFDEPVKGDLTIPNEAYDINIFKKIKGDGTANSQWIESGSQLENYTWESVTSRGKTLTNVVIPVDSSSVEVNIDISGHDICGNNIDLINDLSGTFDTGGYLLVIRRNFKKAVEVYGVPLNCFTINSQYIFVPPSQSTVNYSIDISNSSPLALTYNSSTDSYTSQIPVYNAYTADGGSFDVDTNLYLRTEEVEVPVYKINNIGVFTDVSDNVNYENDYVRFDLSRSELIRYYPDYGPVNMFIDVSYNWYSPDAFDLSIGQIGGDFNGINAPVTNTSLKMPFTISTNVLPHQALTNKYREVLPSNTAWNSKNRVTNIKADFLGDDTNRVMAIKWDELNPQDLCANFTGYEYAIRVYKKRAVAQTPNDQWYEPVTYNGVQYYRRDTELNGDGTLNQGYGISGEFYPQNITTTYMYFFADASGQVFYNDYPADESVIVPFKDTDAGGYLLVIQRNYTNQAGEFFISTTGKYFGFIPPGDDNPFALTVSGNFVSANPTPFSSYNSIRDGGDVNIQYLWTIELPTPEFFNVVAGETTNTIDTDQFVLKYKNRDNRGILTSVIKYNFSVDELPFYELYPLSSIDGNGLYEVSSIPYMIDLCAKPDSYPPPSWARYQPFCPDPNMTSEEREALQMRRKAETLKHLSNHHDRSSTKTQHYAFVAKGLNQKRQTYATQTDSYTNPNTKNYPVLSGRAMTLPTDCSGRVLTFPSTCSDVPGPIVPLTYDPNVPLVNYKTVRTYVTSLTENFETK